MFSRIGRSGVCWIWPLASRIGEAEDRLPVPPVGDLLDGEIKFVAGGEIDDRRGFERSFGVDRGLGADQPGLQRRVGVLERRDRLHIRGEGGRRGVHHGQVEILRLGHNLGERGPMRRRVDELAVRHERGRLREPGRVPERRDLAFRLVAGAGAAVEPSNDGAWRNSVRITSSPFHKIRSLLAAQPSPAAFRLAQPRNPVRAS